MLSRIGVASVFALAFLLPACSSHGAAGSAASDFLPAAQHVAGRHPAASPWYAVTAFPAPVPPAGNTGCGAAIIDSSRTDDVLEWALCPLQNYGPNQFPFINHNGSYTFLPPSVIAFAINSSDEVIARDAANNTGPIYRYRNGIETILPQSQEALDVNDKGGVAGSTAAGAAFWSPANAPNVLGPGFGVGINENGTAVVGWQIVGGHAETTLYKVHSGQINLTPLGPQGFYGSSNYSAVNNKMHAVFDESNTAPFPNAITLPMYYDGKTVVQIPLLSGDASGTVRGLTDRGVAVGFSCKGNLLTVCAPFVYYRGQTHDLRALLPSGYNLTVNDTRGFGSSDTDGQRAIAISDDGIIFVPAQAPGSANNCGGACLRILKLMPTANNPLPHLAHCDLRRSH